MHLLRLFVIAWLAFGAVTVSFLFLLCKRTAVSIAAPVDPPPGSPATSAGVLFGPTFSCDLTKAWCRENPCGQRISSLKAKTPMNMTVPIT